MLLHGFSVRSSHRDASPCRRNLRRRSKRHGVTSQKSVDLVRRRSFKGYPGGRTGAAAHVIRNRDEIHARDWGERRYRRMVGECEGQHVPYCNESYPRIARQRLRKHPTRNNKTTGLCNPLLGSSPVNTFQHTRHATMEEDMFSMRWRHQQYGSCFLCVVRAEGLYETIKTVKYIVYSTLYIVKDSPVPSSERAPNINKPAIVWK
jgi:hypothetical protein